jgi:hypothetical protein
MSYFNDDQRDYMRSLASLPAEEKCACGWYVVGQCLNCATEPRGGRVVPVQAVRAAVPVARPMTPTLAPRILEVTLPFKVPVRNPRLDDFMAELLLVRVHGSCVAACADPRPPVVHSCYRHHAHPAECRCACGYTWTPDSPEPASDA